MEQSSLEAALEARDGGWIIEGDGVVELAADDNTSPEVEADVASLLPLEADESDIGLSLATDVFTTPRETGVGTTSRVSQRSCLAHPPWFYCAL